MAEMLNVLDEHGRPTGRTKARSLVHRDGDWHRTVHVWLLHGSDLLLQLRGKDKDTDPGLWDISCAGHLGAGENLDEGLSREFKEELGLELGHHHPRFLGELASVWDGRDLLDREFNSIFLVTWEGDRPRIDYQKEEIDAVIWTDWRKLKERVEGGDDSLVEHAGEFQLLFGHLGRRALAP